MTDHDWDNDLISMVERLKSERAVPRAAFRGDLQRKLMARLPAHRPRPARLRATIVAWAGSGSASSGRRGRCGRKGGGSRHEGGGAKLSPRPRSARRSRLRSAAVQPPE